ncbi:hypothetical protein D0Y65_000732 [Glycine soja]|nr:hypothetical protein D0Y65_000732 [Glycine soja]
MHIRLKGSLKDANGNEPKMEGAMTRTNQTAGLLILSIQQVGRFGHMPDFRINQLGRVKLNFIILVLLSIFFDMFEIGKVCCWMTLWVLATSCGFV